uniref:ABM domain-containing protein n=1 Tax=Talaromyces marneffei PM1 TaxID=1077442 RepID=A0A093XMW2_TALMA
MAGISVHGTITIDPKNKDTFLAALKPTFDAIKAEPLNLFFEISYDEKNAGVFKLIESWNCTSEYIMSTQLQKDYYKPYHAAVEPLLISPSRSKSSTAWVASGPASTPPSTLPALKCNYFISDQNMGSEILENLGCMYENLA